MKNGIKKARTAIGAPSRKQMYDRPTIEAQYNQNARTLESDKQHVFLK